MKKQLYFFTIIGALLMGSCVSEFHADLSYEDSQILVVDGSIIGGSSVMFYVGKSFSLNENYTPEIHVVDAKLVVTGDNGYSSKESVNMGNGYYRLYIDPLEDEVAYKLIITCASGEVYESLPEKPLQTPLIDSLSFRQPEGNDVHFYLSTHDAENNENAQYFYWTYLEEWEVHAHYFTEFFYDPVADDFYQGIPNSVCWGKETKQKILIGSTEALSENRLVNHDFLQETVTHSKFDDLFRITVTQRAISREAYQYYSNQQKTNEDMGGLFTPQPSEVEGNIKCITNPDLKVIGYVDVVKNTSKQELYIYSYELKRTVYTECMYVSSMEYSPLPPGIPATPANLYLVGYRPVAARDVEEVEWAHGRCTDCVIAGGNLTKPEGWPRY